MNTSTYIVNPSDIVKDAHRLSAERVCLYRNGYKFCSPQEDEVIALLSQFEDVRGVKYKLQVREGQKWRDVTKYRMIFDKDKLIRDARRFVSSGERRFLAEDLVSLHHVEPGAFSKLLSNVSYDLITSQYKRINQASIKSVLELFREVRQHVEAIDLDYMLAYLELYEKLLRTISTSRHPGLEILARTIEVLEDHLSRYPERFESDGAQIAALNLKGQVLSIQDRSMAAECFAKMRDRDVNGVIGRFYLDMGANTYYQFSDVCGSEIDNRLDSIRDGASLCLSSERRADWCILVSVDPHFFRIYAPLLYFYAQQLPTYDFHFLLVGSDEDIDLLEEEGRAYANSLGALNRCGSPSNVYFSRARVPGFVQNERTFFACVRFLFVDRYLELYPHVYVMDADVFLESDPRPFFEKLSAEAIVLPVTDGLAGLSPWRRHLAGNVSLRANDITLSAIQFLQMYLARGLSDRESWMLDQNAWTCVAERFPDAIKNMNEFARPIVQPRFRSVWEANYWNKISKR